MNNWDDLRYFLEIARGGSITAAAKALGVNHSTVSRRIKAYEENNGVRLFDRTPAGFEITAAGDAIYDLAVEIEAQNQKVTRSLYAQDSRLQGDIDLTMPHDVMEFCLIEDIERFLGEHPEVNLNMFVSKGLRNLAAREADIAVRFSPSPPEYLIGRKVANLHHGIYAAEKVYNAEVQRLVVWERGQAHPSWAKKYFPNAKIVLRVNDLHAMYTAVRAGVGIARMPCYLPDLMADDHVKKYPIRLPLSDWGLWVLSHPDLKHTARVQKCKAFFIEALLRKKQVFEGETSRYFPKP